MAKEEKKNTTGILKVKYAWDDVDASHEAMKVFWDKIVDVGETIEDLDLRSAQYALAGILYDITFAYYYAQHPKGIAAYKTRSDVFRLLDFLEEIYPDKEKISKSTNGCDKPTIKNETNEKDK